ncbi:zinc ribbon domain-containing protein [uncultured Kordia sp.]|uniref:zinc ribbon domain-containing protein n=1 Tax=uncultured Kordia sp. TaxID=507699 RepID=UPI00260B4DF2|nr:zinc ribbon domain-containing protein [uncultured Kordia sp.]
MKKCPRCDFEVKNTYKFCPSCKTTFNRVEQKTQNKKSTSCNGCGKIILSNIKFCEKCSKTLSQKNRVNKIDNSISRVGNILLKISASIGVIVLFIMVIQPIITGEDFVIESVYNRYLKNSFSISTFFSGFIAELIGPIIIPLILIYFGFKKNENASCLLTILLFGLVTFTVILFFK